MGRNLYDEKQMDSIRREYGIPVESISESMADAIDETKDTVVAVATTVADGVAKVDRSILYFIAGTIFGAACMVVSHLI